MGQEIKGTRSMRMSFWYRCTSCRPAHFLVMEEKVVSFVVLLQKIMPAIITNILCSAFSGLLLLLQLLMYFELWQKEKWNICSLSASAHFQETMLLYRAGKRERETIWYFLVLKTLENSCQRRKSARDIKKTTTSSSSSSLESTEDQPKEQEIIFKW